MPYWKIWQNISSCRNGSSGVRRIVLNCLELFWIVSHVVLIFLQISELLLVFIKSTDVCCLEIEPGKYPQNTYIFLTKQSPQLAASLKRMKRHNSLLPVHNSQKIITKLPWKKQNLKSVMGCLFYEGNEVHFYLDNELMFEAKADSGSAHRVRAPRLKKNWGCFCKLWLHNTHIL